MPRSDRTSRLTAGASVKQSNSHQASVDGLRGLAALAVFYGHSLIFPIDPSWSPPSWLSRFEAGQAAVLVFFVLSGYVIGLTNSQGFTAVRAADYVRRRFVRLAPINALGVGLALLAGGWLGARAVGGNLIFLENDLGYFEFGIPTLSSNPNLWSLNYEVVCYLFFLVVWRWAMRPERLLIALLIVGFATWYVPGAPRFIGAYAFGLIFWLAGLALAWLVPDRVASVGSRAPWPSAVLLALVSWKMDFLGAIFRRAGLATDRGTWISPAFLDFLPLAVWLVALASGRENRYTRALPWVATIWLAANLLWRAARGTLFETADGQFYVGLFLLAIVLLAWRPSLAWLARIAPLGGISFGFYAFAFPVQQMTAHALPSLSGSATSYILRLLVCTIVACVVAWWAERRLQPWIKRRFTSAAPRIIHAIPQARA